MVDETPASSKHSSRTTTAIIVALLTMHAVLGIHAATKLSVTNDEFWHIPTGLWNLEHGRFHYENLNPPLLRVLPAAPLWLMGAKTGEVAENAAKEARADAFVAANRNDYSRLVFVARIIPILLSVCTGWILASWAKELFGPGAAVLAVGLWGLSPNVIAHSSLVTSDVASAGAFLLAVRYAWMFAERPSWGRAGWLGVCLGAAQLVKFTCVLAWPLVAAVWVICRTRNRNVSAATVGKTIGLGLVVITLCLLVTNAGYLFRGSFRPLKSYSFQSSSMQNIVSLLQPVAALPVPFPEDYIEGIDHQRHIMEGSHPVYLDREMRFEGGFPDYYFKAWLYKTPHATQLLLLLGLLTLVWPWRRDRQLRLQIVLLLPIGMLLLVANGSSMQLGLRYLIPAFPFAFLIACQVASVGRRTFGFPQVLSLVLLLGLATSLRHHPEHLSYFNEGSGGPENGHLRLLDSNIDWGQGLLELKSFMAERDLNQIGLAYFGAVNPEDLGIKIAPTPQSNPPTILWPKPEPGVYAVSTNFLMGRPGMVRGANGITRISGPHQFGYFQFFTPRHRIGYSLFIYELTADDIAGMPVDR